MGLQAEGEAIEKVDLGPTRTRRDILNYVNLSALFPFDLPPSFINQKLPMRSAPSVLGKRLSSNTRQRKRHRRKKGSKQMKVSTQHAPECLVCTGVVQRHSCHIIFPCSSSACPLFCTNVNGSICGHHS